MLPIAYGHPASGTDPTANRERAAERVVCATSGDVEGTERLGRPGDVDLLDLSALEQGLDARPAHRRLLHLSDKGVQYLDSVHGASGRGGHRTLGRQRR